MYKQRKYALTIAAILSITLIVGGCKDAPSSAGQVSSDNSTFSPSTPAKQMSFTSIEFKPSGLIISPGAKQVITVQAVLKDTSLKDITHTQGIAYTSSTPDILSIGTNGVLSASPEAITGTTVTITAKFQDQTATSQVKVKSSLADTVATNARGEAVVTNPADLAVVVNKQRYMPGDYVPNDLVAPNVRFSFSEKIEKRMMRSDAAKALEQLFAQADKDKIKLFGVSGYRSYATQKAIYSNNVRLQGDKEASQFSAHPGQSEHQTGLAIDLSSASAKYQLEQSFGDTIEGKWLAQNAADFGFILRYPRDKEATTGYSYEPWHIRYVGIEISKEIAARGITLEDYFQDAVSVNAAKK